MIENLVLSFWLHNILVVPPLNGTTVRHFQIWINGHLKKVIEGASTNGFQSLD